MRHEFLLSRFSVFWDGAILWFWSFIPLSEGVFGTEYVFAHSSMLIWSYCLVEVIWGLFSKTCSGYFTKIDALFSLLALLNCSAFVKMTMPLQIFFPSNWIIMHLLFHVIEFIFYERMFYDKFQKFCFDVDIHCTCIMKFKSLNKDFNNWLVMAKFPLLSMMSPGAGIITSK